MPQILLHPDRYAQLEAFAVSLGVSLAEAVAVMLNREIAAGHLNEDLPGVIVQRHGDNVALSIENVYARVLPIDVALGVAAGLERTAAPGLLRIVNLDADLEIARKGRGVIVTDFASRNSRSFTSSLALDLARLIRKAAQ